MATPEEKARQVIDGLLKAAGWKVQNIRDVDLGIITGLHIKISGQR